MSDHDASRTQTECYRIVTTLGNLVVEVDAARAPHSAAAFRQEVAAGGYAGAAFTRIVRPDNDQGRPTIAIVQAVQTAMRTDRGLIHEPTLHTGLRHLDGTLSFPRIDGGGGSAQTFFICIGPQPALDEGGGRTRDGLGFAAFGRVVHGMSVVRAIHRSATLARAADAFLRGQIAVDPVVIHHILVEPDVPQATAAFDLARPV